MYEYRFPSLRQFGYFVTGITSLLICFLLFKVAKASDSLVYDVLKYQQRSSNFKVTEYQGTKNPLSSVIVSIKDQGKGIDPEILSKIFNKFVTKSQKGTGLGLYIAKSIIEAHGGEIWAENNKEGKGATFSFRLGLSNE